MTSISARCYLKNNKRKVILLAFLFMITIMCYFGEIYISDSEQDLLYVVGNTSENITLVYLTDVSESREMTQLREELKQKSIDYMEIGIDIVYGWETSLGFSNSCSTYTFKSVEDLKTYNDKVKVLPKEIHMEQDGIIASELYANNVGIKEGELVESDDKYLMLQGREYQVQETFKSDGYFLYVVDKENADGGILCFGLDEREVKELEETYAALGFMTESDMVENIVSQCEVINQIYYLVVIMLAIVLAVTVYASFKGVWDKRKFEFSLYKAIGFSNKQLIWKNIKEILSIALLGSAAGVVIQMLFLYIMNHTVWQDNGMQFRYFSMKGIEITVLCDLLVLLPFVISQLKTVRKLDITEY